MELLQTLEGNFLLFLQESVRCAPLSAVLVPLSHMGDAGLLWIVLSLILAVIPKTRKAGLLGLAALLMGFLVNNVLIKNLVARPRPYAMIPELTTIVRRPSDWSFPSGHSYAAFAAACSYWRALKGKGLDWLRWLTMIAAFLMAFSRLYGGVHYPTDVLCGGVIGAACAWVTWKIYQKRMGKLGMRKEE